MDLPNPREGRSDGGHEAEFDRLRRALATELPSWPAPAPAERTWDVVPLVDVVEHDDAFVLDVELPGVTPADVGLEVAQGRLVITGERRRRRLLPPSVQLSSRTAGRFRLEVSLPADVDAERVQASLEHGVLSVHVPKSPVARRRRIPITARPHGREAGPDG